MSEPLTPTPRQLERALGKTVSSEAFCAAGTRHELEKTASECAPELTPGRYLNKTASDPSLTPPGSDTTMLPSFSTTSLVPPELLVAGRENLKRFEMDGLLGRGGTASVYAVRDNSLGRRIALKLLRGRGVERPGVQQRFVHEARVTAMLEHPNIVPVYDIGLTEQGRVYFLMKDVIGKSVGEAIRAARDGGEVPEEFRMIEGRIRILLKVCDAVAYAHARGFVHQDLKPDNIMLGDYGEVLVMDWGCAIGRDERGRRPGGSFGTPAYMSPEQARQKGADERSDVYCLGSTLFHMVTLRFPVWDDDPERFWTMKRSGELTPLPPQIEAAVPRALLDIARTAMAPEPAGRYQDVAAFRNELVRYQAHAESIALTHHALAQLKESSNARDYAVFTGITTRLEQALEMWPENTEAAGGLHRAKRSHALCALEKGDLVLAESVIAGVDNCEDIAAIIAAERSRRAIHRRRGARALYGAAALSVVLLAVFGYYAVDYFRYFGKWQLLYHQNFTAPDADTSGLAFSVQDLMRDEPPSPRTARGITLQGSHMFWLRDVRERGDVRLEVKVSWPGSVDGLELMINSRREQGQIFAFCPTGYSCQFGGWMGTMSSISRNDRPQYTSSSNAITADFKSGRTYRLWFQREGEEVSLFVDGRKVFSVIDPLPLAGPDLDRIAVRSWTDVEISAVSVWRMGSPAKASPLIAGDAMVEEGLFALATRRYRRVAQDHAATRIAEQALVRAYLAAVPAQEPDSVRMNIRAAMRRDHPSSRYWPLLLETDARRAWNEGRFTEALSLAQQALERDPMSRIALYLLEQRHDSLSPQFAQQALALAGRTRQIASLSVPRMGLSDLGPIAGLALRSLNIDENNIESLEPLAGMPLRRLSCARNRISSLAPLRGMPLIDLAADDNRISDLGPLQGMPLSRLTIPDNRITSLQPLQGMPLVNLRIHNNQVTSLGPLRGMALTSLRCSENTIEDLRPLSGMPLRYLYLASNPLQSLEGIEELPLEALEAQLTGIHSLEPLKGMMLKLIDISYTNVTDLSPLAGMPLEAVMMNRTGVHSLEALRGAPLQRIDARDTRLSDLSPVAGMPLRRLLINRTDIRSLEPLRGMPLELVSCWGTPLSSLEPFEHKAPAAIEIDTVAGGMRYIEQIMRQWTAQGDTTNVRMWRVLLALRAGDIKTLKSLASRFDGRHFLYVPYFCEYESADSLSRALGGHLPVITSRATQEFLLTLMPLESSTWLGIVNGPSGQRWCTGEPVIFHDFNTQTHESMTTPTYLLNSVAVFHYWYRATVPELTGNVVIEWDT